MYRILNNGGLRRAYTQNSRRGTGGTSSEPKMVWSELWSEVGLFCVIYRTVFARLPPEKGIGRTRKLRNCLRNLTAAGESSSGALLTECLSSCELSAAFLLQRLRTGHQAETLLMVLATIARIHALIRSIVAAKPEKTSKTSKRKSQDLQQHAVCQTSQRLKVQGGADDTLKTVSEDMGELVLREPRKGLKQPLPEKPLPLPEKPLQLPEKPLQLPKKPLPPPSETEDMVEDGSKQESSQDLARPVSRKSLQVSQAKLKRLYRWLKDSCKDSALLKRTCLKGLRNLRTGQTSLLAEARKLRAVAKGVS